MSQLAESYQHDHELSSMIEDIRKLLPIQNPLHSFVHNNILIHFEHLTFHEGVQMAGRLYNARSYASESFFRMEFTRGAITRSALEESIAKWLESSSAKSLRSDTESTPVDKMIFRMLTTERPESNSTFQSSLRYANTWEYHFEENFHRRLHDFLIPFIASYLDQGLGLWRNPFQQQGLWAWFDWHISKTPSFYADWFHALKSTLSNFTGHGPEQIIHHYQNQMGLSSEDFKAFCVELLFDLKGWSGMVNKLETEPHQAPIRSPNVRLLDWLSIRLVTEDALNQFLSQRHQTPLNRLRIIQRELQKKSTEAIAPEARLQIWQEAYERSWLDTFISSMKRQDLPKNPSSKQPTFQFLFCIDDREESIRRHVEREVPDSETFGVIGSFGLDMKFFGANKTRPTIQCPPVVEAKHSVYEVSSSNSLLFRSRFFQRLAYPVRSAFQGWFLGTFAFIPFLFKIIFPRWNQVIRNWLLSRILPSSTTRIVLDGEGGYSLDEQAAIVAGLLQSCGVAHRLSNMVILVAHGSSNVNNPFRQAYGCGACSGNPGFPNSRAFAAMANHVEVRAKLKQNGLSIPDSTTFIAAYHDTCSDDFLFFDQENWSDSVRSFIPQVQRHLKSASQRNASERALLFSDTVQPKNPAHSHAHVRQRSIDLAQPRPEFGHCRVGMAIIGRRERTSHLNLDRRSFLISYDPDSDPSGTALASCVGGAVPVCANISLDYYFSSVDNDHYGAGTKPALNVSGFLGVITGSKSDLRIGLARQMVEIHEPRRILVLVEAPEERIASTIAKFPRVQRIIQNEWIRWGRIDPETGKLFLYENGTYRPFLGEVAL